jgi:Patatin-like phospholipase
LYFAPNEVDKLLIAEREFLRSGRSSRRGDAAAPWTGVALSGGGIRAATFSLGVLQALAATNLLKSFDYISSVSGGGYIASSLQWWWSETRRQEDATTAIKVGTTYGLGPNDFPYGISHSIDEIEARDTEAQTSNLAFLRNHGYYLIPGDGMSGWSAVSVVLRTILLSFLVWIPLVMFIFLVIEVLDELAIQPWTTTTVEWAGANIKDFWSPLGDLMLKHWAGHATDHRWCAEKSQRMSECVFSLRLLYALLIWSYAAAVALFVFGSVVFALLSRSSHDILEARKITFRVLFASFGVVSFFGLIIYIRYNFDPLELEMKLIIALASIFGVTLLSRVIFELFRHKVVNWSYFFRRWLEWYFGKLFVPAFCLLLVGLIPTLPYYLVSKGGESGLTAGSAATGLFGLIGGSISALYGYYTLVRKINPGLAGRIFAPIGAAVYLYGTLTFGYVLAIFAFEALANHNSLLITAKFSGSVQIASIGAIILAAILGITANVNYIGLHRFYRDRLMEAFMPAAQAIARGKADHSPVADRLLLSDLVSSFRRSSLGRDSSAVYAPFPLINTLAILTKDADDEIVRRGGDNFVLTPLFVGSGATGWESTISHIRRSGPITLASAMAASGAAVNSNAGYIGTGVTRDRLLSAAMTILNMRLGLWVVNPGCRWLSKRVPTYFHPMLTAGLLGFGHRRTSAFVELSDGGNFDNLGLYELVRRKLSTIIVVDGEADSTIALPALISAAQRIREDFGAIVSLPTGAGPERLVPASVGEAYPAGAHYAEAPFLVCRIRYADGSKGTIIYVKATFIEGLSLATRGYRAGHPNFPHETTVDQFFDPDQFEAYRDLGFRSAMLMSRELDLSVSIDKPEEIWSAYSKVTARQSETSRTQVDGNRKINR